MSSIFTPKFRARVWERLIITALESANAVTTSGCHGALAASDSQLAESFVEALNEKNVARVLALSGLPFFYCNQEWKSAPDGAGFTLGNRVQKVVNSEDVNTG